MDVIRQSTLFRLLATEHPGIDVWPDEGNTEGDWSYFWIVSKFAPDSVRNLVYVRLQSGRLERRTYDEAGEDFWLPAE